MKIKVEQDYKQLRAAAYPSLAEQLDIIYHQGFDAWKKVVEEVKQQYPKSNGVTNG